MAPATSGYGYGPLWKAVEQISFCCLPLLAESACSSRLRPNDRSGDQRAGLGLATPGPLSRGKFSQCDCDAALRAVDSDLAKRERVNFAETGSDHHSVVF